MKPISAFLFLFLILFVVRIGKTQNVVLNKQLDNSIAGDSYFTEIDRQFRIKYFHFGDKIVRLENTKLQLFNQQFEKEWQIGLEIGTEVGNKYHYLICNDSNFVYLMPTRAPDKTNGVLSIVQIDRTGNLKTINFSDYYDPLLVRDIQVIDGDLYVISARVTNNMNKYFEMYDTEHSIVVFDNSLELKKGPFVLPHYEQNSNCGAFWMYKKLSNGNFLFETTYYRNAEDEPVAASTNYYRESIMINSQLEMVSQERIRIDTAWRETYVPHKYDIEKYKMTSEKGYGEYQPDGILYNGSIEITRGAINSGNLIEGITALSHGKIGTDKKFQYCLVEAIADPINDNIVLILRSVGASNHFTYAVQLDKNMQVDLISEFYAEQNDRIYEKNFAFTVHSSKRIWQTKTSTHKKNAFDFAIEKGGNSQYTILNYDDYQIVFEDNLAKRETYGYKIVR